MGTLVIVFGSLDDSEQIQNKFPIAFKIGNFAIYSNGAAPAYLPSR